MHFDTRFNRYYIRTQKGIIPLLKKEIAAKLAMKQKML